MKKSFFFLLSFILLTGYSFSQQKKDGALSVPVAVSKQLKILYATVSGEIWSKDQGNNFEAAFLLNKLHTKVLFDEFGNVLQVRTILTAGNLSKNTNQYIATNFPEYKIEQVFKNESGGEDFYFVNIRKTTADSLRIVFDMSGNYVKTFSNEY